MAFILDRFGAETHAALRIMAGLLFMCHGGQKLLGWPASMPEGVTMGPQIWLAGAIELVGGALVAIGLLTRQAAFLCSGLMAVAYWKEHGTNDLFPINNGGELAALYCFLFLFFSAHGSGIWSVDAARGGRG
jgi:putative oxidoreductase